MREWLFRVPAAVTLTLALHAAAAVAQDLPPGQVIDDVICAGDRTQSYAVYLPSNYSRERAWPLLMGFHPAARGRAIVDTYREAAEKYGYIVAGSNNSRNGPWEVSMAAVRAMSADIEQRLSVDANRLYLTGHSGGTRVAMQVALDSKIVAGVIASSAGYPDSKPRKAVPFVIFGTAGTEDFNYIELRLLDRALTTPHRVAIFEGGHTLPPADVALEAIEWLELQAMKSERRQRNEALIDQLLEKRQQDVAMSINDATTVRLLQELAADFTGLRDVSGVAARAAELSKQKEVKKALDRERADDDAEARQLEDLFTLEAALKYDETHLATMGRLRDWLARTARQADAASDSPERRRARRLMRNATVGAGERVQDAEYRKLLQQYRPAPAGRGAR
jgi:pimeloyl-ACP methyl ester carboxylesterase